MREILVLLESIFKDLTKRDNMPIKLMSLLCACMLWVIVNVTENRQQEEVFSVELKQINLPAAMTIHKAPEMVRVHVRGPRAKMHRGLITATVDLTNAKEGEQEIAVKATTRLGEVVAVRPEKVKVAVDTIGTKTVPVRHRMVGNIPEDMTLSNVKINPDMVELKGANRIIAKVSQVNARVDVSQKEGAFETESDLVAVSDDGYDVPNLEIAPNRVSVSAKLVSQLLTVELPVEVVTEGQAKAGYEVEATLIDPARIKLSAPPTKIKGIIQLKTKPIDISNITTDTTMVVGLELPEHSIPEISAVTVQLKAKKTDSETVRESVNNSSEEIDNSKAGKHENKN